MIKKISNKRKTNFPECNTTSHAHFDQTVILTRLGFLARISTLDVLHLSNYACHHCRVQQITLSDFQPRQRIAVLTGEGVIGGGASGRKQIV